MGRRLLSGLGRPSTVAHTGAPAEARVAELDRANFMKYCAALTEVRGETRCPASAAERGGSDRKALGLERR